MSDQSLSEVSEVLTAIQRGDRHAAEDLLPLVYEELRKLASNRMAHEAQDHTLQATALVHEAYLRLVGNAPAGWEGRAHFFAAAAEAMRRILIERARSRGRLKRGGDRKKLCLDDIELVTQGSSEELEALTEALDRLNDEDPKKAELVRLRFFAGLTLEQAANLLKISRATAARYWTYSRAWLFERLNSPQIESQN